MHCLYGFKVKRLMPLNAIALILGSSATPLTPLASAQVIPDSTLGNERSRVVRQQISGFEFDRISGGALRGQNLFHSFEQFDVGEGLGAYFDNPTDVQNIFSRVTGGDRSEINGFLGVLGDANLFLMNPNGIIFGPNSSIDVGGSFTATSANAIQFGAQGMFSASSPEVPSALLTVNPSAFLFNQPNPGGITNRSSAFAGTIPPGIDLFGLRVPDGEQITLLGGDISLEAGSRLFALGGRIHLGAVDGRGTVTLNSDGSLSFPTALQRGDVTITDRSGANIRTLDSGGAMNITARTITLTNESVLLSGIFPGQGAPQSRAGDIQLDATEQILLTQASTIANVVFSDATGAGGNIVMTAPVLAVQDRAQLDASTFGQGNAGNVILTAGDRVTFQGTNTTVFNTTESIGNGGTIEIAAPLIEVLEGAQLQAGTNDRGNVGDVRLVASDRILFSGTGGAVNRVEELGSGRAGTIEIKTPILDVLNGAQLSTSTLGSGNAGNVLISASDRVTFSGGSGALSQVNQQAIGDGGTIEISAPIVNILNDAELSVNTSGSGNAGRIRIISTDRVTFNDAIATSAVDGRGNGGTIEITAPVLNVLNGAQIQTLTRNQGDAGDIVIRASDRVTFDGSNAEQLSSAAFSRVEPSGVGNAGTIKITAPILNLLNGAQLSASTSNQGNAGNVEIVASDRVVLNGVGANGVSSGIFTQTTATATGRGGRIAVTVPHLEIANGAVINARTATSQPGGDVVVEARRLALLSGGQVVTTTLGDGRAGTIRIDADRIRMAGTDPTFSQRQITFPAQTLNEGRGESGLFAATRPTSTGNGGSIDLITTHVSIRDRARISAQSQGTGSAGGVTILASETMRLSDRAQVSTESQRRNALAGDIAIAVGNQFEATNSDVITSAARSSGGNIRLTASTIRLVGDSDIRTNSAEDGGNITLAGNAILAFGDSDILAAAAAGRGGDITLNTPAFFGENYQADASQNAEVNQLEGNNRVDINASGQLSSGTIATPDTTIVQNSLANLPDTALETDALLASSCVVRSNTEQGTFRITGSGGALERPGETPSATYQTGTVRSLPDVSHPSPEMQSWQPGDSIFEPQGAYLTSNGRLILSRECSD